ncbi:three-Cys-motif partner protein TcmP [Hyphomonas sp.]|jgi:three-Cys-motif partner protein
MPSKSYQWEAGAILGDHSKKKHQILREYLSEYLRIRCSVPQQSRFRLAVVDAFCGGGVYAGGEVGSPIIFLDTFCNVSEEINLQRAIDGMAQITFECFCIFNDEDAAAIAALRNNLAPHIARCQDSEHVRLQVHFMNSEFEDAYPIIKARLAGERVTRNVFFNLDQCGSKHVKRETIVDILRSYQSAEILLTFAIRAMMSRLPLRRAPARDTILRSHGVSLSDVDDLDNLGRKPEWRAAIEQLIFDSYRNCAPYVSPFAINNPDGWLYWLLHFANEHKARQVYNDLLHENSGVQGHMGRAGLNMLTYDPSNEGIEYLFQDDDRQRARDQLMDDIPKAISEFGDAVLLDEFLRSVANETPAHSMDINQAMIDNPDIKVETVNGGERRSASGIRRTDSLIMKPQRSLFFMPPLKGKREDT